MLKGSERELELRIGVAKTRLGGEQVTQLDSEGPTENDDVLVK